MNDGDKLLNERAALIKSIIFKKKILQNYFQHIVVYVSQMMAKGPRTETGLSCHISAFVAHIHTHTSAQASSVVQWGTLLGSSISMKTITGSHLCFFFKFGSDR